MSDWTGWMVAGLGLGLLLGACKPPPFDDRPPVRDGDRARVERWFADWSWVGTKIRPDAEDYEVHGRWLFVNGQEVKRDAFLDCVTTPGHFTLGADGPIVYGDKYSLHSVCCGDRTIHAYSGGQRCHPKGSFPGYCWREEWIEFLVEEDGSVLAMSVRSPACPSGPEPTGAPPPDAKPIAAGQR